MADITPENPLPNDVQLGTPGGGPLGQQSGLDAAVADQELNQWNQAIQPHPPEQVATVAPAPPPVTPGGRELSMDGLLAEADRNVRMAHAAGEEERKGLAAGIKAQQDAATAKVDAARAEAKALAPVMQYHANQSQILEMAQEGVRSAWQTQQADLALKDAELNKEYDDYQKRSHPTDIWGQAGVNPIVGRIAVALAGINSAVNGGPNQMLDYVKTLAASRAAQLEQEGRALGMRGSRLAQLHMNSSSALTDGMAANDKLRAMLLDSVGAQIDQISNNFREPKARAEAQQLIGQLQIESAKLRGDSYNKELQARLQKFTGELNIADHLMAASAKQNADKTAIRKTEESASATAQALSLIQQIKAAGDGAQAGALRSQLATMLAKAENPGSDRILPESGREAEIGKLGGFHFLGNRLNFGEDLDGLAANLIQMQQQRDHQMGTNTTQQLLQALPPEMQAALAVSKGTPVQ